MYKKGSHIVSKFEWNTVFDNKEQAFALQERLSEWCRIHLQKEAEMVFNRLCPADQTWKIDRLEINLGTIDLENLERELSRNLGRYLEIRLRELILYDFNTSGGIEITTDAISFNDMIACFLLHGVLPWSASGQISSVNQILTAQLNSHFMELIDMFSEIGKNSYVVRKRMAWQFSDSNLCKIIEGIEPVEHTKIISFRDELYKIQQQEKILSTGTTDFRKQLWEWILNYVYVERGSFFNERSFMKSSIRQMADHYNISYGELLSMIQMAVQQSAKQHVVSGVFISVFNDIFKEEDLVTDHAFSQNLTDHWTLLQQWFEGSRIDFSPDTLIRELSRSDNNRFKKLIYSLHFSLQTWTHIAGNLNDTSLDEIVFAQDPNRSAFIVAAISFLISLCNQEQIKLDRALLWATAIRNLRQNRDAATGNRLFIMDSILCLSKTNHVSWEKMLVQLVGAPIPKHCKTTGTIEVMEALNDVFSIEISNRPPSFFNHRFEEQLRTYFAKQQKLDIQQSELTALQETLRKYIRLYPSAAFDMLMRVTDKPRIQGLFTKLIDHYTAGLLLQQRLGGSYHRLLQQLIETSHQFSGNKVLISHIEANLMRTGLEIVFLYPVCSLPEFAYQLLKRMFEQLPASLRVDFVDDIIAMSTSKYAPALAVFNPAVEKIYKATHTFNRNWQLGEVYAMVRENKINQEGVRVWLHQQVKSNGTGSIIGKEAAVLANHLLKGVDKLMNALIGEILGKLFALIPNASKSQLTESLHEIFWKCLLSIESFSFSTIQFQQLFKSVVMLHYPILNLRKFQISSSSEISQKMMPVSHRSVLRLAKKCFENCEYTIFYERRMIKIEELIIMLMDNDIDGLYSIIASLSLTQKQIDFISSVIGFSDLRASILQGGYSQQIIDALADMSCMIAIVQIRETDSNVTAIEKEFSKELLQLKKGGDWGKEKVNYYLLQNEIATHEFVSIFTEEDFMPGPNMREILVDRVPGLSDALPMTDTTQHASLANILQKGLLPSLIQFVIRYGHIPSWYLKNDKRAQTGKLLDFIITQYPIQFVAVLRRETLTDEQIRFLEMTVNAADFFRSIRHIYSEQRSMIHSIEALYKLMNGISFKGVSERELQSMLFKRVLGAWMSRDWEPISIGEIWNTLAWDLCLKTGIGKDEFVSTMSFHQSVFPVSLIVSLEKYKITDTSKQTKEQASAFRSKRATKGLAYYQDKAQGAGISVKNAGIVLLNSYIPLLFERLEITRDGKFINADKQDEAVHCLQFLVTGLQASEEHLLPLNKILCGLPISEPLIDAVVYSEQEVELMEGLLYGVISHWSDSGSQTPDGLRGNWLIRNGVLRKEENGWELLVEHKPYDLLLQRSPFSFSVIKFPWMPEPLTVKWKF